MGPRANLPLLCLTIAGLVACTGVQDWCGGVAPCAARLLLRLAPRQLQQLYKAWLNRHYTVTPGSNMRLTSRVPICTYLASGSYSQDPTIPYRQVCSPMRRGAFKPPRSGPSFDIRTAPFLMDLATLGPVHMQDSALTAMQLLSSSQRWRAFATWSFPRGGSY